MASNNKSYFECSVCNALFVGRHELKAHIHKDSPSCNTSGRKKKLVHTLNFQENSVAHNNAKLSDGATALVAEMEALTMKSNKEYGLETSLYSMVADGDYKTVQAYKKLDLNPDTGRRKLNSEMVAFMTTKANMDAQRLIEVLSCSQTISICFLVDTTESMSKYILGVKEQIIEIAERVKTSGCYIEGLAFVGYKDWCDGKDHFEILSFTKSIDDFRKFIATINAKGGGDFPEDVLGGLKKAVYLSWPPPSGTRIIFHLGDAPPHGKRKYHPDRSYIDDYRNGHPSDPSLTKLFVEMRRKKLIYFFGRINNECDRMISVFENYYGGTIAKMNNTEVTAICDTVTESVMRSVSISSSRASTRILTMTENNAKFRSFNLDQKEPENWAQLPRLDCTTFKLVFPESIEDITSFVKLEEESKERRLQIAPNPFAKGSVRLAYYGKILYPLKDDDVVFKEIISFPAVEELDRERYMTDLEVQTIAAKLAKEFNAKLSKTDENPLITIKFLMAKVARISMNSGYRYLTYEKRFRGDKPTMIKYTNSLNMVIDPKTLDEMGRKRLELAIAFSHFTYNITNGYLLVCDLQGISDVNAKGKNILLLTDPAIHCTRHIRFGGTNLNFAGVKKFFENHLCNKYCKALRLNMNRAVSTPCGPVGKFENLGHPTTLALTPSAPPQSLFRSLDL